MVVILHCKLKIPANAWKFASNMKPRTCDFAVVETPNVYFNKKNGTRMTFYFDFFYQNIHSSTFPISKMDVKLAYSLFSEIYFN